MGSEEKMEWMLLGNLMKSTSKAWTLIYWEGEEGVVHLNSFHSEWEKKGFAIAMIEGETNQQVKKKAENRRKEKPSRACAGAVKKNDQ